MSTPELLMRLRGIFVEEARERIARANAALVRLERSPDADERRELVGELFREAHSIKGAAAAVGLPAVESLAHGLESQLDDLRRTGEVKAETCEAMLRVLDEIDAAVHGSPGKRLEDVPAEERPAVSSEPVGPSRAPPTHAPTVRVPTERLDGLLTGFGELLSVGEAIAVSARFAHDLNVARRRPSARRAAAPASSTDGTPPSQGNGRPPTSPPASMNGDIETLAGHLREHARRVQQVSAELRTQLLEARLVPLSTILDAFPRMVRDLAREQRKAVELVVTGAETEVDRSVLEPLRAPLGHLVRNALDHGIETTAERAAAGKPAESKLLIEARTAGDQVSITVRDDGRGVDTDALRQRALRSGIIDAVTAESISEQALLDLLFLPGFTTSPAVTELSGRGVGLDVVRDTVEQLHGTVAVRTEPGKGTAFEIKVPLSAATLHTVFAAVDSATYAFPAAHVERIVRVGADDIVPWQGRSVIDIEGEPCEVAHARTVLGLSSEIRQVNKWHVGIVVAAEGRRAVLLVDEIQSAGECLVRPIPPPLNESRWASGAVVTHAGRVAVLLNPPQLLRHISETAGAVRPDDASEPEPPVVVVAEDSFATRMMEKAILEAAGYRVRPATDGLEAWEIIDREGCDLVVCDVMMPRLDGFELTSRLRADERFRRLPVVLVTSLDSPEDRRRGAAAGADAYIAKGHFERERLLETIRGLI